MISVIHRHTPFVKLRIEINRSFCELGLVSLQRDEGGGIGLHLGGMDEVLILDGKEVE